MNQRPGDNVDGYTQDLMRLGVTPATLTAAERRALDVEGYVVLEGVVDGATLDVLRSACDGWRVDPQSGALSSGGNMQVGVLFPGHTAPLAAVGHARVLAGVWHVLARPFQLGTVAWRNPRAGLGQQGLHADWPPRADAAVAHVVTGLCLLDDYTASNGPTRVVPGSHLIPSTVPKAQAQPLAHHPRERTVAARAGSVVLFNGHLWHSGTRNTSGASRRVMQVSFRARGDVGRGLRLAREDLADPALRHVLDLRVFDPAVDLGGPDAMGQQ